MSVCLLLRETRDLELLPIAMALAAVDESRLTLLELSRRGGIRETNVSEPLLGEPSEDPLETQIRDWLASPGGGARLRRHEAVTPARMMASSLVAPQRAAKPLKAAATSGIIGS